MSVIEYCEQCKRKTDHGGLDSQGGCNVCREREESRYQTKKRIEFEEMTTDQKLMFLYDQIKSR